jgi:tRNA-Thr(GGU) m(6)t(6)A37 methyltransferase TsaA
MTSDDRTAHLETIAFSPIGVVRNGVTAARDEEWGRVVSEIQLEPELADGLVGLEQFSHVLVLFLMHEARFDAVTQLTRRPRDRTDMPLVGVFAQRARHRPNPIAVTAVELKRVEGASLFVRGLDAIDGTPVLDVKPHVPAFDAPGHPRVPDWMSRLMEGYF